MRLFSFLFLIFLSFKAFHSSAAYLVSKAGGGNISFKEWHDAQQTIQRQVWQEGKSLPAIELEEDLKASFVPESLIQAFALHKMHKKLIADVLKMHPTLEEAYNDVEGIPVKFIGGEWVVPGKEAAEVSKNEEVRKHFLAEAKKWKKSFLPSCLDWGFLERVNKTRPTPDSDLEEDEELDDWGDATIEDVWKFFFDINTERRQYRDFALNLQFRLEKIFLEKYAVTIAEKKWSTILKDFYPMVDPEDKKAHFTNIAPCSFTEPGFLASLDRDYDWLSRIIQFEQLCEDEGKVAILRGQSKDPSGGGGELPSISFSRGYYSGIFRDAHSSPSWRAKKSDEYYGFAAERNSLQELLIIPPLSWYKNLGLGGEFWHPRTTVAHPTVPEERVDVLATQGTNNAQVIDKIGVLIKEGDTDAHFGKVKEEILDRMVSLGLGPVE